MANNCTTRCSGRACSAQLILMCSVMLYLTTPSVQIIKRRIRVEEHEFAFMSKREKLLPFILTLPAAMTVGKRMCELCHFEPKIPSVINPQVLTNTYEGK